MAVEPNIKTGIVTAVSVIAASAVIAFIGSGISKADSNMNSRMTEALRKSLLDSAVLCYSVEGAYPENITYLSDKYGIKYDKSRYIVNYRYVAANIRPDIIVIEKR